MGQGRDRKRLQENPVTKVFVAQTSTAGLGITLTAEHNGLYSMSYNAADYNKH